MSNPTIEIPVITALPTTPVEAAKFIWEHQNKLNAISHPKGQDTISIGQLPGSPDNHRFQKEVVFDYHLALLSEVNELMENFLWKHWSKEAREGKRWNLIAPEAESGPGSMQNVRLEITDIIFFTVSLLHVFGIPEETWVKVWGDELRWATTAPEGAVAMMDAALTLSTQVGLSPFCGDGRNNPNASSTCEHIISSLVTLCRASGLSWDKALDLYSQKLIKNYERQRRGRSQVGDVHSEKENSSVR